MVCARADAPELLFVSILDIKCPCSTVTRSLAGRHRPQGTPPAADAEQKPTDALPRQQEGSRHRIQTGERDTREDSGSVSGIGILKGLFLQREDTTGPVSCQTVDIRITITLYRNLRQHAFQYCMSLKGSVWVNHGSHGDGHE